MIGPKFTETNQSMVFIAMAPRAFSQGAFVATIEPSGVQFQQSPLAVDEVLYGAEGVNVENFNRMGGWPLGPDRR
jgi:hypothetical protein